VIAGGELLLRKDIPEIVAYAAEQGLEWAMHTHGLHVPKFRSLLARHPPALAAISLDGERELHDLFRGRRGSFDGALAAIRLLKEVGCREVVAGTTVTRRSADRVADMFPVVAASGADSWGLHLFAPEGRGAEHLALFPTPEQLRGSRRSPGASGRCSTSSCATSGAARARTTCSIATSRSCAGRGGSRA
jgi:MoaA/NifB/PqqE/SkfB family radical SAM enzyme